MKKYAIVSKKLFGYGFNFQYVAYEYTLSFRAFGPEWAIPIYESSTHRSAEECENLLRRYLSNKHKLYSIVRIVEL